MRQEKSSQIQYFVKEALYSLRLSRSRTLISIATIGFALFIFGIYLLVSANIKRLIEKWQEEIHIEIFLSDELTLRETDSMGEKLRKKDDILQATYISKKMAWEKFQRLGYEQFFEGLSKNPLPASFQLKLRAEKRTVAKIKKLSAELLEIPGVEDVTSGVDLIEKLEIVANFIKVAGFFAGLLIFIASIFIISNTIKLSLFTRVDEIDIMKLVGGTNSFIMMPYLFEGIIQGLVGAGLAIALLFLAYQAFLIQLRVDELVVLGFGYISFVSASQWLQLMLIGILIGLLGSYISVSQFLRPRTTRHR
ncbi:cell division protein FtsX [candidate division CSSED10-310 bacterium]|uniref:Cell division protein FtsX n=1 Tax=candidate division CSSED10-310 bacterium TaxID=2855610 RepID=A0ABV6YQW2_UNCC1